MADNIFDLTGRIALVTGASSGLGNHFAEYLAEAGAKVICAARRTDRLEALVTRIENAGGQALAVALDVKSTPSVTAAFAEIVRLVGVPDVVVNNAGVATPRDFVKVDDADWDDTMEVNLKGVWRVASAAARLLVERKIPGSIINVSSMLGLGGVQPQLSCYQTSKAGVVALTRSMATELFRYGIRVNALCPGYIKTEMNEKFFDSEAGLQYIARMPQKRLGAPSELRGALVLLASNASSFMTGVALPVDGGHSIRVI